MFADRRLLSNIAFAPVKTASSAETAQPFCSSSIRYDTALYRLLKQNPAVLFVRQANLFDISAQPAML
jgi:hypothetical protein